MAAHQAIGEVILLESWDKSWKPEKLQEHLADIHRKSGVKPTAVNSAGQTFAHIAASVNIKPSANAVNTMPILKFYFSKRVDINAQDERGRTVLHYAAQRGNLYVVQELLKLGANPDLKTVSGKTALRDAIDNGQEDVARFLMAQQTGKVVTPQWMGDPAYLAKKVLPSVEVGSPAHPLPETTYTLADPSKPLGPVQPRTLGQSALFPKLTGVGRNTRKHGHTRLRRRARGRLSRRKIKA